MNFVKLAQAAMRYKSLKSTELTADIVRDLAVAADVPYSQSGIEAVISYVRSGDTVVLGDLLNQPGAIDHVLSLLSPEPESLLIKCPHCLKVFEGTVVETPH